MAPEFHETRMGRQFLERTVPELVRQVERLADAMERNASREATRVDAPQDELLPFASGAPVVIVHNPHHADASDIVGEVVEYRSGVGFAGCDLVMVRYHRPRDGSEHVMPFGAAALDRGDRQAILARAARHDMQAARLRAMAAGVGR